MAYQFEKEGDLVIAGFETGIGPSPHKGLANIQNANLATETGEVVNSFARVQQSMTETTTTGSLSFLSTDHVNLSIAGSNNLFKGTWITVTSSSNTGQLPNGTYYVPPSTGAGFQLATAYNVANFIPTVPASALVVAGGGGGSGSTNGSTGGGGGAGGVLTGSGLTIQNAVAYTVTVGAGGAGGVTASGSNGNNSVFSTLTAIGGGGGGVGGGTGTNGASGGSGGGGGQGNPIGSGGAGTTGQGKAGGNGANTGSSSGSGGGGGASAVGSAGASANGGAGGAGTSSSVSGSAVTYAGGGGGGGISGTGGTGGSGGSGGGGAGTANATTGGAGTANTGGGGGGSGGSGGTATGGAGGSGVVIISIPTSYGVTATGGTHTQSGGNDIWTFTSTGTWTPTIPSTTVAPVLTGFGAGLTATIQLTAVIGKPLASCTETFFNAGTAYHRYYVLDNQNLVWVYDDHNETLYSSSDGVGWFLPDYHTDWCTTATGIAVISGFLIGTAKSGLFAKPVVALGNTNSQSTTWVQFPEVSFWQGAALNSPHTCYVGHQGTLYITDGNYIANVFPDSTLASASSTSDNVQSLSSWTTFNSTTGIPSVISGSSFKTSDGLRLPVVFFTPSTGSLPVSITANTVYYISGGFDTFNVYSAASGGSALDIQTGAFGTQYFATFYPLSSSTDSVSGTPTYVLTPQRLTLPQGEVAQCMSEIGNQLIIGCQGSTLYPWNQVDNLPAGIIPLPEGNVPFILTVHQMAYVLAGSKGNIYITDGSSASLVTTVPDYTAGVPGTPSSYIEPPFTWGGAMYLQGRIYFSILDQTSTKAGNCGGIWSFVPTQNFYVGQDIGIGLRLESQASYGTYNGYSPVLIPKATQGVVGPQYWNAWQSDITTPKYGIDTTGSGSSTTSSTVVETDAIPTGTMLDRTTYKQIEVKFATQVLATDKVTIAVRKDLTSAWTPMKAVSYQPNRISAYCSVNFEKSQWLQVQVTTTPGTSSSFMRLSEIRIR